MWSWIVRIFNLIFGVDRRTATDILLGQTQQQRNDAEEAQKEDRRAEQIDQDVNRLTDSELDARLRPPPDPGGTGR